MKAAALVLVIALGAAQDITFQLFDGPSCNQNSLAPDKVVANVNSISSAQFSDSGCVAATFESGKFSKFVDGFKCNIYTDTACQSFSQSVTAPDGCDSFPGSSIKCFSQAEFDNPFIDAIVNVTVSQTDVGVNSQIVGTVGDAIDNSCSGAACDGTPHSVPYQHFGQSGQTTVTVTGSFADTNQRDYMKALMIQTQTKTVHNIMVDTKGSPESDDVVANQFTSFEVDIRDKLGRFICNMIVKIDTTTQPKQPGNCGFVGSAESLALGEVPAVGGLLSKAFNVVCANS